MSTSSIARKMTPSSSWFEVDKKGLAKLVGRRGKAFLLYELLQNAWDCEPVSSVNVTLKMNGRNEAELTVVDDHPDGFKNLSHAYTLFAESEKKGDPSRRGRFNLGEKLVLALCKTAVINSTQGTVCFTPKGRVVKRIKRPVGTMFQATLQMTHNELEDILVEARKAIPPQLVRTSINGTLLSYKEPLLTFRAMLQTEIADESGFMTRKYRHTPVSIYRPDLNPDDEPEKSMLYEMGIPVMELGDDPFHVNVGQKIPMGMERDAVTSLWLKNLRACVLDQAHKLLTTEDACGKWASDGLEEAVEAEAIKTIITKRYGEKAVVADPSDREGENIAKAQGYTIIPGGAFTAEGWEVIRNNKVVLPAGQVTPSPKPFSPGGKPLVLIPRSKWMESHHAFHDFARQFAEEIADLNISVEFTSDREWPFNASYSKNANDMRKGEIILNCWQHFGHPTPDKQEQLRLIFHELAHHWGHHLETGYHDALCRLAAKATRHAIENPESSLWAKQ